MNTTRLGAIDIGSNSVRLLITDVIEYKGKAHFKKEQLFRIPLRLGEDTFSTGYICDRKKEKLAILLQSFQGLLVVNDVENWRICATSALREATNRAEVINYISKQTGLDVDIIDTKEEARYIVLNSIQTELDDNIAYLFTDVGGGSTDLILFYQGQEIASESFRIGTIRTQSEELEKEEWERLNNWVLNYCKNYTKVSMIGSGGNINKLDSLLRRCGRIRREELISFSRKFRGLDSEERILKYNINSNRAEVLLPAINIYLRIMKISRSLTIETPIIGVVDGIIKDLYINELEKNAPIEDPFLEKSDLK